MLDNIRSVQLYLYYEERASLCTYLLRWHFELILLLMDFHTFSFSVADSIGKRLNTSTFNAWSFVSCCSALPRYRRKAKVSERTGASLFPFQDVSYPFRFAGRHQRSYDVFTDYVVLEGWWLECRCLRGSWCWWSWRHWFKLFHRIIAEECQSLVVDGLQVTGLRNWATIYSWITELEGRDIHSLVSDQRH